MGAAVGNDRGAMARFIKTPTVRRHVCHHGSLVVAIIDDEERDAV
jgi:hypothetical protein